jgi:hypothetical protein
VLKAIDRRLQSLEAGRHIDALRHVPFRLRAWTDQQAILWRLTRSRDMEPITPRELAYALDLRLSSVDRMACGRPRINRAEVRRVLASGELVSLDGTPFLPDLPGDILTDAPPARPRPPELPDSDPALAERPEVQEYLDERPDIDD